MSNRTPPHDLAAEEAVLGACLLSPQAINDVHDILLPGDFYKPAHQYVFDAICTLWNSGRGVDAVTVAGLLTDAEVLDDIGGAGMLLDLQTSTPAISQARVYAQRVVRTAQLRAAISAASEILDSVYDGKDPETVRDLITSLAEDTRLLPREIRLPELYETVEAFMERYAATEPEEELAAVVPGPPGFAPMLRARHRALFVAPEGSSKTTIMRQIGMAGANGFQPFSPGTKMRPIRVLNVDCENPADAIAEQVKLIDRVVGQPWSQSPNLRIWHQEAGLDLRASRRDQATFEAVIADFRPELVTLGPVYKIYSNTGSSGSDLEQSAIELFRFLDGLRARFGFALIMEHHVPKGMSGKRELVPFGTVAWQRWPEFGIRLLPEDLDEHEHPHKIRIKRFRGDRVATTWPMVLDRSARPGTLPWVGTWADRSWGPRQDTEEPPAPPPPTDDDW